MVSTAEKLLANLAHLAGLRGRQAARRKGKKGKERESEIKVKSETPSYCDRLHDANRALSSVIVFASRV